MGQLKSPGPGGLTVIDPVVWPFLTGNAPVLETGPPTVSLLPACGWLPPLLKHWYTAVASAAHEMFAVVKVLPSPASLNEHTSWPLLLITVGLDGVRADIAMMRTPDGHGRVELTRFHTPPAVRTEPQSAPANALGIRRIMFAVDDLDDVVARLRSHGAKLVGEIAQYEDSYRLCFVRGPEGFIVGLAEQLS